MPTGAVRGSKWLLLINTPELGSWNWKMIHFIQLAMWNESIAGTTVFFSERTLTLELVCIEKKNPSFQIESLAQASTFDSW